MVVVNRLKLFCSISYILQFLTGNIWLTWMLHLDGSCGLEQLMLTGKIFKLSKLFKLQATQGNLDLIETWWIINLSPISIIYQNWLFLKMYFSEGSWHWAHSKEPLTFTNWWPGEPKDTNDQDCGVVRISEGYNLWWDDVGCEANLGAICQINWGKKIKYSGCLLYVVTV